MKILNLNGDKIKACFVFIVGNCEVSVSTIFNENRPEIAIFDKGNGKLLQDKLQDVSDAISWARTFGPRD